jgi:hypothetical protein
MNGYCNVCKHNGKTCNHNKMNVLDYDCWCDWYIFSWKKFIIYIIRKYKKFIIYN